jgi:multidrug efflux system membrane fusion protein
MNRRLMERPVQNSIDSDVQRPTAFTIGRRLAALSLAALLGGCHQSQGPAPLPVAVVSVAVQASPSGEAGAPLRYPIEVAARYSNGMSFRIAGQLIERRVRLGDAVRKGEVLARLDSVDAEKQAAIARAALQAAESRLTFAKQQIERDRTQASQELIAQSQLEQTQDAYSAALAARAQAVDQLALALNTLRYNSLIAEHNGIITSENADTGQVLSAGQPVYGLAWSDETDVILDAAPSDLPLFTAGRAASVTFLALPERRFEARVREVSPAADPQSRTYRVKLTLADPGPDVRLGMTGEAVIARASSSSGSGATPGLEAAGAAAASAVADGAATGVAATDGAATGVAATGGPVTAAVFEIPATAVFHKGESAAVWTIRPSDSTLELRPISVRGYGERTAYIDRGLREGDSIVAAGVHTVYAGEHVTPVKPLFAADDTRGEARKTAAISRAASTAP